MGVSVRYFLHHDGEVVKIPRTQFMRFLGGELALFPQYASEVLEIAELLVVVENRKPVSVSRAIYFRIGVARDGRLDEEYEERVYAFTVSRLEPATRKTKGRVIDASEVFRQRALESKAIWQPTPSLQRHLESVALGRI